MSWSEIFVILTRWVLLTIFAATLPFGIIVLQLWDHDMLSFATVASFWSKGELLLISMAVLGATFEDLWSPSNYPKLQRAWLVVTIILVVFCLIWFMDISTSNMFSSSLHPVDSQKVIYGSPFFLLSCLISRLGGIIIQKRTNP